MKVHNLIVKIDAVRNSDIDCTVYDKDKYVRLSFSTDTGSILFDEHNYIAETVGSNQFQFSIAGVTNQSGYGGFIQDPEGNREVYRRSFKEGSSNLMELLAVSEGLKRLEKIDRIQINTDSRFVIRGLIQWVHFWKHNNWQTAYDSSVKYVDEWKLADKLCEGKIIEFNWVKGHSGHEEQDFCHKLARESAIDFL